MEPNKSYISFYNDKIKTWDFEPQKTHQRRDIRQGKKFKSPFYILPLMPQENEMVKNLKGYAKLMKK